ncbi:MAG TPA: TlpA disulfide reductase family protein [Actinomycetota bacterium]|nr:TlpA disulfide reductase family protein [Actinomycetota bacterium]
MRTEVPERPDVPDGAGRPRRPSWRTLALVLVPLAAFALLLAASLGRDPRALPSELVGDPAPAFALPNLEGGGIVDLEALRGQVVVVNFWASWCLECRDEHPALDAAWSRYRERGVVFVGVLFEDTIDDALAFAGEFATDWPLVDDPGSRTAIAYGVFGVPETFVIGPDGSVTAKRVGPVDYTWLTAEIDEALRAAEAA